MLQLRTVVIALVLSVAISGVPAPAAEQNPPAQGGQQQQPQQRGRGGRGQTRDRAQTPAGTSLITGRVLAADTGRPLKRARVVVTGAGRPFSATTDELGRYRAADLPAGEFTVTATKTGYVDASYGQRRPTRPGTPITVGEGQQVANIDIRLPRGGVITGRVVDEDGEPLARTTVNVLRFQYVRGQRQLATAGADQTDDRGQYRVFGLPPGEYLVSASVSGFEQALQQMILGGGRGAGGRGEGPGGGRGGRGAPGILAQMMTEDTESTGYAPTYYPGAISSAEASRLKLAAAQELGGIDFQLQVVPLATVRGTVTDGRGNVMLIPEDGGGGLRAQMLRAPVQGDGSFVIYNVPPGKYTAVARSESFLSSETSAAMQALTVTGGDVTIVLTPVKGAIVSGTVTFESVGTPTPSTFSGIRVNAVPLDSQLPLPRTQRPAEVNENGFFSLSGLTPGRYAIQANAPRGWTFKSAVLGGVDVSDEYLEIKGGENLENMSVVLTDRISSLSGTVRAGANPAPAGLTVIVFPAEEKLWRPQPRRIQTARTTASGTYRFNALPPGDYLVIVVDDVEQGEWFDPAYLEAIRNGASRVRVNEGEQETFDLKWSAQ